MGWSLKGILQGAAAGAADWAVRGQAADLQAERDAAQFERSKELARYNDELGGARTASTLKLKQEIDDRAALREAESIADNSTLAGKYAAEKGAKPGSKEWHVRRAEFLNDSGRTAMAKDENTLAEKYDDNEIRREQNAAANRLAGAKLAEGASRRRGEGGTGDGGFDVNANLDRIAKNFGTSGVPNDKGELKIDPNAPIVATRAFKYFNSEPSVVEQYPDPATRQRVAMGLAGDLVAQASVLAQKNNTDLLAGFNLAVAKKPESVSSGPPTVSAAMPRGIANRAQWDVEQADGALSLAKSGNQDALAQIIEWKNNPSGLTAQQRAAVDKFKVK